MKNVRSRQLAFGYTYEELKKVIEPMVGEGVDPIGSMGYDSPLAVFLNVHNFYITISSSCLHKLQIHQLMPFVKKLLQQWEQRLGRR